MGSDVLLLGFCFVLYFLNLGQWDLWNPDEPRYAQVAREMIKEGIGFSCILMERFMGTNLPSFSGSSPFHLIYGKALPHFQ